MNMNEGDHDHNNKKIKRKSLFKLAEETSQRLHKQREKHRQEMLNSLTEFSASSWLARRLIHNAMLGKTGDLRL